MILAVGQSLSPQGINNRQVLQVAEWDYSAIYIANDATNGSGLPRSTFPCFSSVQGCADPTSETEAYARLQAYYDARVAQGPAQSLVVSVNGHFFMHHYAGEWGVDLMLSELGENINGTQAHNAFARGAAIQYQKPWGIDMSSWFGPSIRDYRSTPVWGDNSSPVGGHSDSLTARIYLSSYMSGAAFQMDEAGSINFFANESSPMTLSDLGQVAADLNTFAATNPQRGTPFVPFAIVLDKYHGMGISYWYGTDKSFGTIPLDSVRLATRSLFETIWPNAFEVEGGNESQYEVASPYGDSFDVLLETAGAATLSHYSVLIFSGHLDPNSQAVAALPSYLSDGGMVVVDASSYGSAVLDFVNAGATAHAFGSVDIAKVQDYTVGAGEVIVVGDSNYWANVLAALTPTILPFDVSAGAQFLLNKFSARHWVITLINNYGVTKAFMADEVVDTTQTRTFTVTSLTTTISSIAVWRGSAVTPDGNAFSASVAPGQVAVYEVFLN